MDTRPRILASTTSHRREPLVSTLDVFGRLGLRAVDLNLHPLVEGGVPVASVVDAVAGNGLTLYALSGGWCDFYTSTPEIEETFASVARQADMCRALGVRLLRLFFGRLEYQDLSPAVFGTIVANLSRLSGLHPDIQFVLENHDGASLVPEVCRDVLQRVGRPNIRMNFDPINFAKAGVDPMQALRELRPLVAHVHLKGLSGGEYCEFGEGDVDLGPVLKSLVDDGYTGAFTVEYEGPFDATLRLYRSVARARAALGA